MEAADGTDWSRHPYAAAGWEPGLGKKGSVTAPVQVQVMLNQNGEPVVNGVLDYDDRKSVAKMKFLFGTSWVDPRLADWPASKALPKDLWMPEVHIGCPGPGFGSVNKGYEYSAALAQDAPPGTVLVNNHAEIDVNCGATADISQFPLDRHLVSFFLLMPKGSAAENVWSRDTSKLTTVFQAAGKTSIVQEQEEWRTSAVYWGPGQHVSSGTGLTYSDFMVAFERRRMPQYMLHSECSNGWLGL